MIKKKILIYNNEKFYIKEINKFSDCLSKYYLVTDEDDKFNLLTPQLKNWGNKDVLELEKPFREQSHVVIKNDKILPIRRNKSDGDLRKKTLYYKDIVNISEDSNSEFKISGYCWPKVYYKKHKKQYSKKLRFAIFNENKFTKYIDIPISIILYKD